MMTALSPEEQERVYNRNRAFDNITETVQEFAKVMKALKCCCCEEREHLREATLFFCDTHYNKYKDIISIENK